jgi:uncharacterized protein YjbI with pentapeptide repeats
VPATAVTAPRVAAALTPFDLSDGGVHDELLLDAVRLTGAAPDTVAARAVELTRSLLQDAELAGARLPHLSVGDCVVQGGNLANVAVRGGVAQRSAFEQVRLTGLSWHEGTIRDVTFRGCRIDLASFAASRLERVRFEDCLLVQAELQDARLASVVFTDCDLSGADFSGARLSAGCELHGCRLDGARAVERLRGARMPLPDVIASAAVFAATLGIGILDDETDDEEQRR